LVRLTITILLETHQRLSRICFTSYDQNIRKMEC
jgi:hypothetical protein